MQNVVYFRLLPTLCQAPFAAVTAWFTSLRTFGESWAWLNIARLEFGSDEEILTVVFISGSVRCAVVLYQHWCVVENYRLRHR